MSFIENLAKDATRAALQIAKDRLQNVLQGDAVIPIHCLRCCKQVGNITVSEKDIVQWGCECGASVSCALKDNRLFVEVN